jgi:hypothetical protein
MATEDGWKREAMQLRENYRNDSAAMAAFVELFEVELGRVNSPILCLALHHVGMRFHSGAGKKTVRKMLGAGLENLPEAIYPKDRIPTKGHP